MRLLRGAQGVRVLALPRSNRCSRRRGVEPSAVATKDAAKLATTATGAPLRMAFIYVPNGVHQAYWWPKKEGKDFELTKTLQPLEKVKQHLQLLGGLDQINATAGPDGPGDHARASGSFLTGVRVKKTAGADIHAGISVDQLAAQRIGHLTRFPSLELTCDSVRKSGSCDSGYSCAYQYNLSWSGPTLPVAPEPNPRLVFERLFGAGAPAERRKNLALRQEQQRSILDFVLEDTRKLEKELGGGDQQKLDEYLAGVREIERRIQEAEKFKETPNPNVETPTGVPGSFPEHIGLMFDMMVLAFQTDSTRVATFLLANEGSNRTFPEIGISEGHHNLSHHFGKKDMMEKIGSIDRWYVPQQLAKFPSRSFRESIKDVRRAFAAAQFHDRLWERKLRRQPAHAFKPSDHPRRGREAETRPRAATPNTNPSRSTTSTFKYARPHGGPTASLVSAIPSTGRLEGFDASDRGRSIPSFQPHRHVRRPIVPAPPA